MRSRAKRGTPSTSAAWLVFAAALVISSLLFAGCGPGTRIPFSYRSPDNRQRELRAVLSRLDTRTSGGTETHSPRATLETEAEPAHDPATDAARPTAATTSSLAVALSGDEPSEIVAFEWTPGASSTVRWRYPLESATVPQILGDLVMTSEPERVVALDAQTGAQRWSLALDSLAYLGSARTDELVVYTASVGAFGGATRRGVVVAVDPRSGSVVWRHDINGVVGAPSVAGSLVFVPWERHSLAILDARSGVELTRIRSTDDVIAWTKADGSDVFYGYRSPLLLTEEAAQGRSDASPKLTLPLPELDRQQNSRIRSGASIRGDDFIPRPNARSSRERIRWIAEPRRVDAETLGLVGDRFYLVYYRYVFAFDPRGELRWARTFESILSGAQVNERGLIIADTQGRIALIDAERGEPEWSASLCETPCDSYLAAVRLELRSNSATDDSNSDDSDSDDSTRRPAEARPSLREQLTEVAFDPDNRLLPARAFAVRALSALPDPEISRDLLDLYARPATPSELRASIAAALRERSVGHSFLLDALQSPFDYLADRAAPSVMAIVPALLDHGVRESIPTLIDRLFDPATTPEEIAVLARSLGAFAREDAARSEIREALLRFLWTYRADSALAEHPESLLAVATALFSIDGPDSDALRTLTARPHTLSSIREGVIALYDEAERARAEEEARLAELERQRELEAARARERARPLTLSPEAVNATLSEQDEALKQCAQQALERDADLAQLRVAFVLTRDGATSELATVPTDVSECVENVLRAVEFPRFRAVRMQAQYVLQLRGATARPDEAMPTDVPWWFWWARGREQARPGTQPARYWWTSRRVESPASEMRPAATEIPDRASASTSRPAESTESANESPAPPVQAPASESTEEPVETREEPVETREEPVETREEPVETREEPAQPPATPWWAPASQ